MHATLHTSAGNIRLVLFGESAPNTVANFTDLATGKRAWTDPKTGAKVNRPFYDGLTFHRVIRGFMIQGGCPVGNGTGGPGYTFNDEISPDQRFDRPWVLAMANAGLRAGRGTNGSQFFITVGPTPHLNGAHTIFGEVADAPSRDVVQQIASSPTDRSDRPRPEITIDSVTVEP
jgi:peptidyl-prolyl cis-trans isomerase A (cyclophilin A)